MNILLTKRTWLGALLLLLFVGEVTVGANSGLYGPGGIVIFGLLYGTYFLLLDSLVTRFQLSNFGLVLVNFAIYSVLITGLLHAEIADYVLRPQDHVITTLIRIQCSLYPLFTFYILRRLAPPKRQALTLTKSGLLFIGFVLLMTPTKTFGLVPLVHAMQTAPILAAVFILAAIIAWTIGIRRPAVNESYTNKLFMVLTIGQLVISCIPGVLAFLLLVVSMILTGCIYLTRRSFRMASVL